MAYKIGPCGRGLGGSVAEWSKAIDSKSMDSVPTGSNPVAVGVIFAYERRKILIPNGRKT